MFFFSILLSLLEILHVHACIRALSVHSSAEFNILPCRWQHARLVAIILSERWGKIDRNVKKVNATVKINLV
jgi:hypothetical protein